MSVGRTKVLAYALLGLFAALGGLSLTASTGIGTPVPGPYTLLSVAAVVLGGVSLAGGRGGIVGPLIAVAILQLIRTDMTFLRFDPNLAAVAPGRHPHRRGHGRQPRPAAAAARMSEATGSVAPRSQWLTLAGWQRLFRDRPIVPLLVLLVILLIARELARPGISAPTSWGSRCGRPCPSRSLPAVRRSRC